MNEWETIEQALRASRCAFLVRQLREETRLALNAQCAEALEDWATLRDRYEGECEWTIVDTCVDSHYTTSCGNTVWWELPFNESGPSYCYRCGKPIVEREGE